MSLIVAAMLVVAGISPAVADTDVAAPTIVSSSVNATSLDVSAAPARLLFNVRLADDTAVGSFHARFIHPGSGQYYYFPNFIKTSGTLQNGVWRSEINLPQGVASGDWAIEIFGLEDSLKNAACCFLNVRSIKVASGSADVAPPVLVSNAVSSTTFDVTNAPARLLLNIRVSDATAVGSFHVRFIHPGTGQYYFMPNPVLTSGTLQNGVWRTEREVPQGIASGQWMIQVFGLEDTLKNAACCFLDVRPITVVSGATTDTAPPQIVSSAVSSTSLDVATAPAKLTVSIRVTDETAVQGFHVRFIHLPTGQYYYFPNPTLVSGNAQNGVWRTALTLPQGVANGAWTIQAFGLEDVVKNAACCFLDVRNINVNSSA
ncbi:hypothetical protein [Arthrobacter sp. EpRS71]|uniref:hypothetical protein n=1 Tax=Arthrobacter sp. EpRS71 TaxID=1743141 RepID=UPI000AD1CD32|nr:hypothetical protein [Arthrobacter sp. EpRS71]